MIGELFHRRGKSQQVMVSNGMDTVNSKLAMCKRSRLVQYHRLHFCQYIYEVRSLDKDSLARSTSHTTEEGQWNTDNQGTGAGNHQEH